MITDRNEATIRKLIPMEKTFLPRLLVETWLELAENNRYPDAQEAANRNLNFSFDDINQAKTYIEKKLKYKLSV